MFKFNGGMGAIICDACRRTVKEPAELGDPGPFKNAYGIDICDANCLESYEFKPYCTDCGIDTEPGPGASRCLECWAMRIPGL